MAKEKIRKSLGDIILLILLVMLFAGKVIMRGNL